MLAGLLDPVRTVVLHRTCELTTPWHMLRFMHWAHGTHHSIPFILAHHKAGCPVLYDHPNHQALASVVFDPAPVSLNCSGKLWQTSRYPNVESIMASEKGRYQPLRDQSSFSSDEDGIQIHDGLPLSRPWHRRLSVSTVALSTLCAILLAVSSAQFWFILKFERRLVHPHSQCLPQNGRVYS